MSLTVGAAWSTYFSGTLRAIKHRRLRYAYRAPAFFADESLRAGLVVEFLRFDDGFTTADVDGSQDALAETVDLLYLSCHGTTGGSGYRAILNASDWDPVAVGFGNLRPIVAVFDTCDLLDPKDATWHQHWEKTSVGMALRLALGFSSPATVGQATSVRGRAFVENLAAGDTFVDAWNGAVVSTRYQGTDQPVAVAFGDSGADAKAIIKTASLTNVPAPRSAAQPTVVKFP